MRNQVYRALGSTEQTTPDEEFVEIHQVPVERDSALLICSDGLSDLVPIAEITRIVEANADDPGTVAQQLVDAANTAGARTTFRSHSSARRISPPAWHSASSRRKTEDQRRQSLERSGRRMHRLPLTVSRAVRR